MNENSTLIPTSELIKKRHFDWVYPEITNEQFPTLNRLWNDYKEFQFKEDVSSEEAMKRMQAEGYEPANSHELLLWEGWNGENTIIALGSVAGVNEYQQVLCFTRAEPGWVLGLRWQGSCWDAGIRFLAVRNS